MRVLTAVKQDILNKIVIDNQTDLVGHLYCLVLDIQQYDGPFKTNLGNMLLKIEYW